MNRTPAGIARRRALYDAAFGIWPETSELPPVTAPGAGPGTRQGRPTTDKPAAPPASQHAQGYR